MSPTFVIGSLTLYKSAVVIALGAAACFSLFYALYTSHGGLGAAAWLFASLDLVLSVLFSRLLHYYCHSEQYASFGAALGNYSSGGYVIVGIVPAAYLAALITSLCGLTRNRARLLDCFAPGALLAVVFIRLSALFNSTCRGKVVVTTPSLQRLPIAASVVSGGGAVEYRFATFFVEALLIFAAFLLALRFFFRRRRREMRAGQPRSGNVALIALLMYSAVEIVSDSTRYDSSFLPINGFVSVGQIAAGVCVLIVLVIYSVRSVRARGLRPWHWAIWICWFLALAGSGICEYLVQRHGDWYLGCYAGMSLGCLVMALLPYAAYLTVCRKKRRKKAAAE